MVIYLHIEATQFRFNNGIFLRGIVLIEKISFKRFVVAFSRQDEIGLKEWALSLRSAHKLSQELLGSMARKAGKIYGTERDATSKSTMINSNSSAGGVGGGGTGAVVNIGTGVGSTTAIGGGLGSATNVTSKNTNGSN